MHEQPVRLIVYSYTALPPPFVPAACSCPRGSFASLCPDAIFGLGIRVRLINI